MGEGKVEHRRACFCRKPGLLPGAVHDGGQGAIGGGGGHRVALHQTVHPLPAGQPAFGLGKRRGAVTAPHGFHVVEAVGPLMLGIVGKEMLQPRVVQHDHAWHLPGDFEDVPVEQAVVTDVVDLPVRLVQPRPIHAQWTEPDHRQVETQAGRGLQQRRFRLRGPERDVCPLAQRGRHHQRMIADFALLRRQR